MKLALILLAGLVGLSSQQRFFVPYQNYFMPSMPYQREAEFNYDYGAMNEIGEITFRAGEPLQRQFGNVNPFLLSATATVTSTLINTVTVSSPTTITTTTLKNCVPATQFVVSVVSCRRKRDTVEAMRFLIAPSNPEPIVSSVVPVAESDLETEANSPVSLGLSVASSALTSSKDEPLPTEEQPTNRQKRFFFPSVTVITNTVTVTSSVTITTSPIVFSSTVVPKTITLGGASSVSCIPPGIVTC